MICAAVGVSTDIKNFIFHHFFFRHENVSSIFMLTFTSDFNDVSRANSFLEEPTANLSFSHFFIILHTFSSFFAFFDHFEHLLVTCVIFLPSIKKYIACVC